MSTIRLILVEDEFTPSTKEAVRISAKNLTNIDTLIDCIKSHIFQHYVKASFLNSLRSRKSRFLPK